MLQDMDDMEVSCIFDIMFCIFIQLEQSKICIMTVTKMGIVKQTVQHDMMVSVSFILYPRDFLRQILPDVLSVEECPIYIKQS